MRTQWRAAAAAAAVLAAAFGATTSTGWSSAATVTHKNTQVPAPKGITFHAPAVRDGRPAITAPRSMRRAGKSGGGNLLYHGGPIQHDPQIFLLFWGSWWNSGCSNTQGNGSDAEAYLYNLFHGLGTTSDLLSPVTSQYGDSTGTYPLFPTAARQAFISWNADCNDPPASATDAQLGSEAAGYASFLASEGYSITNNTQIVVVSPSGTNPGGGFGSQYCAYHNWAQYSSSQLLSWTNLPYMPDQGGNCGADFVQGPDDGWSIVGGHEYAESITDPFVNNQSAWYDSAGFEIGDKCAWQGLFAQTLSTGTFAEQPEWDNATSSCQPAFTYRQAPVKLFNAQTHCMEDKNANLTSGAAIILDTCNGWARQSWAQFPGNTLRRAPNTGQCANITNHSAADGTPIDLFRCSGDWNQVWTYNGLTHQWVNPHTGKCLRDANGSYTNGTPLVLWTCISGYKSEQWTN